VTHHTNETSSQLYPSVDALYDSIGMPAQFEAPRLVGVIVMRLDHRWCHPGLDDVVKRQGLLLELTNHVVDAASCTSLRRNPRRVGQSITQSYANKECRVCACGVCRRH
jgi:hypothetical protein